MDDAALLRRYVEDADERFFEQFAARYIPQLRVICGRMLPNGQIDDAIQEALLALSQVLEEGQLLKDPAAWLRACAWRQARHIRRSESARQRREAVAGHEQHEQGRTVEATELHDLVDSAVACLHPGSRQCLQQHYVHGRSCSELARHAGISPPAMRKRLDKALRSLRRELRRRGRPMGLLTLVSCLQARDGRQPEVLVSASTGFSWSAILFAGVSCLLPVLIVLGLGTAVQQAPSGTTGKPAVAGSAVVGPVVMQSLQQTVLHRQSGYLVLGDQHFLYGSAATHFSLQQGRWVPRQQGPVLLTRYDGDQQWRSLMSASALHGLTGSTSGISRMFRGVDPGEVYLVSHRQLLHSDDAGRHWHPLGPLPVADPASLLAHKQQLYLVDQHGAAWQCPRAGTGWQVLARAPGHDVQALAVHDDQLVALLRGPDDGMYHLALWQRHSWLVQQSWSGVAHMQLSAHAGWLQLLIPDCYIHHASGKRHARLWSAMQPAGPWSEQVLPPSDGMVLQATRLDGGMQVLWLIHGAGQHTKAEVWSRRLSERDWHCAFVDQLAPTWHSQPGQRTFVNPQSHAWQQVQLFPAGNTVYALPVGQYDRCLTMEWLAD